jgi:hypothetical protein
MPCNRADNDDENPSGMPSLAARRSHARRFFHRLPRHEIRPSAIAHLATPFSASKRTDGFASPTMILSGKGDSFSKRAIKAMSARLVHRSHTASAFAYACARSIVPYIPLYASALIAARDWI